MVCAIKNKGGRRAKDPATYSQTPAAIRMRKVIAARKAATGYTGLRATERIRTHRERNEDLTEAPGLKPALTADQVIRCGFKPLPLRDLEISGAEMSAALARFERSRGLSHQPISTCHVLTAMEVE